MQADEAQLPDGWVQVRGDFYRELLSISTREVEIRNAALEEAAVEAENFNGKGTPIANIIRALKVLPEQPMNENQPDFKELARKFINERYYNKCGLVTGDSDAGLTLNQLNQMLAEFAERQWRGSSDTRNLQKV